MKRLLLLCSAGAVAAGLAAAPAMAGLAGNTSFSHQLPVHVPQQAKVPQVADDHGDGSAVSLVVPSDAPSPAETHETEPGDDDTPVAGQTEPGDDNGVDQDENPTSATEPEPGNPQFARRYGDRARREPDRRCDQQ